MKILKLLGLSLLLSLSLIGDSKTVSLNTFFYHIDGKKISNYIAYAGLACATTYVGYKFVQGTLIKMYLHCVINNKGVPGSRADKFMSWMRGQLRLDYQDELKKFEKEYKKAAGLKKIDSLSRISKTLGDGFWR